MRQERTTAHWLLPAWLALIVYASLYPFEAWTWPPGQTWTALLALPWPHKLFPWDAQTNVIGYLPLGLLLRAGGPRPGWLRPLLMGAALSYALEVLQNFLPDRVPSASDLLFNSMGALLGALMGWLAERSGMLRHSRGWQESWFEADSAGALALMALWPMALLCPAPVPLGLGRWLPHLQQMVIDALEGTQWASTWFDPDEPVLRALPPGFEALAIALGLLGPVLLMLAVARRGWRRWLLAPLTALIGILSTALSTALYFGPLHAWAWLTPPALPGLALGLLLGLLVAPLPRRACAALGLVVLPCLIALVTHAPADPFLSASLQAWEQGRFVNLYGLGQWLGWIWPFAAIAWLLASVGRR